MFPFEDVFHLGKQKKSCLGQEPVNTEGGTWGSCPFVQKLLNTQRIVGRCTHMSPIMGWADVLSLQNNSLKPNAASHNNASWYTDTDGFLEHSPSGGGLSYKGPALQKIIPVFGGPPFLGQQLVSSFVCRAFLVL